MPDPADLAAPPALLPDDGERVVSLLAELTRGTCQIPLLYDGEIYGH